jgi:hypothetical protein
MTPEHENHLNKIKTDFFDLVDRKYRKGNKKYGDKLWEKENSDLLNEAIDEAIDQVVYLLTLRDKIKN